MVPVPAGQCRRAPRHRPDLHRPPPPSTATESAGERLIHVLGLGHPVDGSVTNTPLGGGVPADAVDFRSTAGGVPVTAGDTRYEPDILPAGVWVVTDRATGHRATGQDDRVVLVTAIATPQPATPAATPPG